MLLHLVDASSLPPGSLAQDVRTITNELARYKKELSDCHDRWVVLNKIDLLTPEEGKLKLSALVDKLNWAEPAFMISAATGQGCTALCQAIMNHLEKKGDKE